MELAYQWELVEDEYNETFEKLAACARDQLSSLQENLKGMIYVPLRVLNQSLIAFLFLDLSDSNLCTSLMHGIECKSRDLEYKFQLEKEKFTSEVK